MTADRRRVENEGDRSRIAEIQASVASLRRVTTWTVTFVLVVLFALGAVTFYLRGQQDALTHRAQEQAQRAAQLTAAVQQSRFENVLRGCLQDAQRNRATIDKYDAALTERLKTASPAERKRLGESRIFFVQLVDAFLPAQTAKQCTDIAHRTTRIPLSGG